jgi:hypothetical protein
MTPTVIIAETAYARFMSSSPSVRAPRQQLPAIELSPLFFNVGRSFGPIARLFGRISACRWEPIEVEATLSSILRKARPGVRLNEYMVHPEGAIVFQHACKMGLEGIVSNGWRRAIGRDAPTGASSRIWRRLQ